MDFSLYLSKIVKVDVSSGYYYLGKVFDVDDDFLSLVDKKGKNVTISIKDILNIREMEDGY